MFAPDVECTVVLGGRLIGSRPREDGAPGLLVSERLSRHDAPGPLEMDVRLEELGQVTALAAMQDGAADCVVVGGEGQVSLASVTADGIGRLRWVVDVDFEPRVVLWDGTRAWAAGCDRVAHAIDDHDWEALSGGGFVAVEPTDGRVVVRGRFWEDPAWGNGGVAVVHVPHALCAIGRRGELYRFDARDGRLVTTSAPISDTSIGIAHAAAEGDRVLYGFNRGGYRLHAIRVARTT
jgi:hypothetical protein